MTDRKDIVIKVDRQGNQLGIETARCYQGRRPLSGDYTYVNGRKLGIISVHIEDANRPGIDCLITLVCKDY
jgi:hypothetical protein